MIKLLDDFVINCIAAGEVVQRPESAVRELVDNAVDAGATQISIYIEEGGESLIKVVDNGSGMSKDDAVIAFQRHATSKIHSVDDLNNILTMGFRGEALASISAVSKVKLKTKDEESAVATEVIINGGEVFSVNETSGNRGTDIEIRNLFYNVPARKKFLRQPKTEALRIKNWVRAMVLAYPKIMVKLFVDSKDSFVFAPRENVFKRAGDLFKGSIVKFENKISELHVKGIVAHPALAKSDVGSFIILVNKRLINSKMLLKAVKEGFKNTLKNNEVPVGFLDLEIAPNLVDVNVHPQKMEVRFTNESAVFSFVRNAVNNATSNFNGVVDLDSTYEVKNISDEKTFSQKNSSGVDYKNYNQSFSESGFGFNALKNFELNFTKTDFPPMRQNNNEEDSLLEKTFKYSLLNYIGQLFKCYLLCEYDDDFYVVDMHAGHERVNYNKLRKDFLENHILVQDLLVPLSVELGEEKTTYLLDHKLFLEKFGIYIEEFGNTAIVIRALPQIIGEFKAVNLIQSISSIELPEIAENLTDDFISSIVARLACHSSIRSGHVISKEEVQELFRLLDDEEFNSACPHGRPVIRKFSKREVECWFGRDR